MTAGARSYDDQKRRAVETHSQQAREFSDSYAELAARPFGSCFAYSRRRLERALAFHLPQSGAGLRLLDVGCGTGHHLRALRARGFEAAGVDGSAAMLDEARRNNPGADFRQSDVEKLPFEAASFDYALCIEVLRYLPDPRPCLREMRRVLRPGGVCLATAAPLLNLNGYWLINRLGTLLPLTGFVRLKQYFCTSSQLRRAFVEAGFQDVVIQGVYVGPINWIERILPTALPTVLEAWEPWDAVLANRWPMRELSNMFLLRAS
jgi:ubiquinone/menaquinone biosynthesis C-methylase UbiE